MSPRLPAIQGPTRSGCRQDFPQSRVHSRVNANPQDFRQFTIPPETLNQLHYPKKTGAKFRSTKCQDLSVSSSITLIPNSRAREFRTDPINLITNSRHTDEPQHEFKKRYSNHCSWLSCWLLHDSRDRLPKLNQRAGASKSLLPARRRAVLPSGTRVQTLA